MSILAKLLQKKNETSPETGQIPPGLLKSVARGGGAGRNHGLYLLIASGSLAAILAGYFLATHLESRSRLSPSISPSPPQPVVNATPVVPVHAVASSSRTLSPGITEPRLETVERRKGGSLVSVATARQTAIPSLRTARGAKQVGISQHPKKKAAATYGVKSHPGDRLSIDAYLFAARDAEARRDYLPAMRNYLSALEADPSNHHIMNNLASVFLQLGLPDEALRFANKALARKRDYISALINAGIAHGKLGNNAAARGMFSRAVAAEPTNPQALFNLALSQERAGMADEAIRTYRRLADGGDSRGYLGMARIQEKRGNSGEALRLYRDILALPGGGQDARETARKRISQLD